MTYILAVSENMQQIRGVSNHVFLPPENTSLKPIGLVPTLILKLSYIIIDRGALRSAGDS